KFNSQSDGFAICERMLLNQHATYFAIVDGFQSHLSQATRDDVVLFYFCGHGSQERALPVFWNQEPDKMNETIVCYASLLPGGKGLADKDLATLIDQVGKKSPHIVVILDCCHSGSGTRTVPDAEARWTEPREEPRSIDSYVADANATRRMLG